jgi:sugar/nucleoside kinase (ribokinase family)
VKPRFLVLGNTVVDLIVHGSVPGGPAVAGWADNVTRVERPIRAALGGCGAGPAYVLGLLGSSVELTTSVGSDTWGRLVVGWLHPLGVDLTTVAAAATAVHVVILDAEGRRRSLYYTGDPVPWRLALDAEPPAWVVAGGYGAVEAADLAALQGVFEHHRDRGARVLFDPGPWFAGRVDPVRMRAAWAAVDCLVGTVEELRVWLDREDALAQVEAGLGCGPDTGVVKQGPLGATGGTRAGWRGSVPAEPVSGANTVGAGDAFDGRLAWGLATGESVVQAVTASVRLATAVVRQGTGVLGARQALEHATGQGL